jgi:hypothetical protein
VRTIFRSITPILVLAASAGAVQAQQGMPTSQPSLLTIYIEEIKLGRSVAHAANEAGWPAAYAKAKAPETYLALESITGTNEVWFVVPFASYAKEGESMTREETDPVLSGELDRLRREDAEYLSSVRTIQLVGRPDLSFGAFPDIGRARFWEITTFRVRPGHDAQFEAAAKLWGEVSKRLAPASSFRSYSVSAGMPGGTYIIFSSVNEYAGFDQMMASGNAVWAGMSEKERAVFDTFGREGMLSVVTNRYRLDPQMSYVDEATKAADPGFWSKR